MTECGGLPATTVRRPTLRRKGPVSNIRPANTVVLLEKRLAAVENAAGPDPMELVGLQDEFQRVERKWVEQIAAGNDRRQPGDPEKRDKGFDRLGRQIERVLRSPPDDPAVPLLRAAMEKIKVRPRADGLNGT